MMSRMVSVSCLVLWLGGCSSGSGSTDSYVEAIASVRAQIAMPAQEWAAAMADGYLKQLGSSGGIDDSAAIGRALDSETTNLNNQICDAIREHETIGEDKATEQFADAERAITPVVEEAAMVALARHASLLQAIGLTTWGNYPEFVLKEPRPAAAETVEPFPSALAEHIVPEYRDPEAGGLVFGDPGDSGYIKFQEWYSFDLRNPLAAEAGVATKSARSAIMECLEEVGSS